MGPERGGEELQLFELFLARAPLGSQGLPMELAGGSEDQFFKILARFRHSVGSFVDAFCEICLPDFLKLLQKFVSC